jgi:hypothetical protein
MMRPAHALRRRPFVEFGGPRLFYCYDGSTLAHHDHPNLPSEPAINSTARTKRVDIRLPLRDGRGFFSNDIQTGCPDISFRHGWGQIYAFWKHLARNEFLTKSALISP